MQHTHYSVPVLMHILTHTHNVSTVLAVGLYDVAAIFSSFY